MLLRPSNRAGIHARARKAATWCGHSSTSESSKTSRANQLRGLMGHRLSAPGSVISPRVFSTCKTCRARGSRKRSPRPWALSRLSLSLRGWQLLRLCSGPGRFRPCGLVTGLSTGPPLIRSRCPLGPSSQRLKGSTPPGPMSRPTAQATAAGSTVRWAGAMAATPTPGKNWLQSSPLS